MTPMILKTLECIKGQVEDLSNQISRDKRNGIPLSVIAAKYGMKKPQMIGKVAKYRVMNEDIRNQLKVLGRLIMHDRDTGIPLDVITARYKLMKTLKNGDVQPFDQEDIEVFVRRNC
jgi:hypothetical protein